MDADVRIGWCTSIVGYGRNSSEVIVGLALMVLRKAPAGYVYNISHKWAEICGITRLTSTRGAIFPISSQRDRADEVM
jgi:hypothetical protein